MSTYTLKNAGPLELNGLFSTSINQALLRAALLTALARCSSASPASACWMQRSKEQQTATTIKTPHNITPIMKSLFVIPLNMLSDSEGRVKRENLRRPRQDVIITIAKQTPTNMDTRPNLVTTAAIKSTPSVKRCETFI